MAGPFKTRMAAPESCKDRSTQHEAFCMSRHLIIASSSALCWRTNHAVQRFFASVLEAAGHSRPKVSSFFNAWAALFNRFVRTWSSPRMTFGRRHGALSVTWSSRSAFGATLFPRIGHRPFLAVQQVETFVERTSGGSAILLSGLPWFYAVNARHANASCDGSS